MNASLDEAAMKYLIGQGEANNSRNQFRQEVCKADPNKVHDVVDGKILGTREKRIEPRRHKALSLAAVDDIVSDHAQARGEDAKAGIRVWVGEGEVVAVLDDDGRREQTVRFEMTYGRKWQALEDLVMSRREFEQRDFINYLRNELNARYGEAGIIDKLRSIKFSDSTNGETSVSSGASRLGINIQKEVTGASQIPDDLLVYVPVYDNVRDVAGKLREFAVNCAIVINLENRKFSLVPKAGEIEEAQQQADDMVRGQLVQAFAKYPCVKVFVGKPDGDRK